ncbi:unnamed protein product [Merluccius merluccius]
MPSARAQLRAAAAREDWWGGAQTASPAKRLGRGEPQWQLGRVGRPAVEQRGGNAALRSSVPEKEFYEVD